MRKIKIQQTQNPCDVCVKEWANVKKRVLAMVMTLAMTLSLLHVPVGAAETDPGTGEE